LPDGRAVAVPGAALELILVESVNEGFAGTLCRASFDHRVDAEGTWIDTRPPIGAVTDA
jgi:hypothetical protein